MCAGIRFGNMNTNAGEQRATRNARGVYATARPRRVLDLGCVMRAKIDHGEDTQRNCNDEGNRKCFDNRVSDNLHALCKCHFIFDREVSCIRVGRSIHELIVHRRGRHPVYLRVFISCTSSGQRRCYSRCYRCRSARASCVFTRTVPEKNYLLSFTR